MQALPAATPWQDPRRRPMASLPAVAHVADRGLWSRLGRELRLRLEQRLAGEDEVVVVEANLAALTPDA